MRVFNPNLDIFFPVLFCVAFPLQTRKLPETVRNTTSFHNRTGNLCRMSNTFLLKNVFNFERLKGKNSSSITVSLLKCLNSLNRGMPKPGARNSTRSPTLVAGTQEPRPSPTDIPEALAGSGSNATQQPQHQTWQAVVTRPATDLW